MESLLKVQPEADHDLVPDPFDVDNISYNLHRHGFAHVKNLLEPELLDQLYLEMRELDSNEELTVAAVGRGGDHALRKNIRTDKTKWLDGSTFPQQLLFVALERIRIQVNERLMLGLFDIEAHYAVYRPGDFYKRHFDSFVGEKNRLLSMVIYFNKDWEEKEGGLLKLYENEETVIPFATIIPEWGHSVMFLSENISHEVTVSHRNRYSIAVWFHCRRIL